MLYVVGNIIIPPDPKLREFRSETGGYLDFQALGQGEDKDGILFHVYHINMWVPAAEFETWKKRIVPKKAFQIRGELVAPLKGEKIGFTQIKTTSYQVTPMAAGLWFEGK